MQKNFIIFGVVSLFIQTWGAHILIPDSCFPCIFEASRNSVDDTINTILAITTQHVDAKNMRLSPITYLVAKQRHGKGLVNCAEMVPIRHARAAEARDDAARQKNTGKRRTATDHNLYHSLCHFKVCNTRRTRTSRQIHMPKINIPMTNHK